MKACYFAKLLLRAVLYENFWNKINLERRIFCWEQFSFVAKNIEGGFKICNLSLFCKMLWKI